MAHRHKYTEKADHHVIDRCTMAASRSDDVASFHLSKMITATKPALLVCYYGGETFNGKGVHESARRSRNGNWP